MLQINTFFVILYYFFSSVATSLKDIVAVVYLFFNLFDLLKNLSDYFFSDRPHYECSKVD